MSTLVLPPSAQCSFSTCTELAAAVGMAGSGATTLTFAPAAGFATIDLVLPGKLCANFTINTEHQLLLLAKSGTQGLLPVVRALDIGPTACIQFYWILPAERYEAAKSPGNPFVVKDRVSACSAAAVTAAGAELASVRSRIDQYLLLVQFDDLGMPSTPLAETGGDTAAAGAAAATIATASAAASIPATRHLV